MSPCTVAWRSLVFLRRIEVALMSDSVLANRVMIFGLLLVGALHTRPIACM